MCIRDSYGAGAPVSPLTGPDGTTNAPASYSQVLTGKATGYYSRTGKGSSGLGLGYGTVAVDPSVIPYGTLLYITSTDGSFVYGYAVATDTGIAVQKGQILVVFLQHLSTTSLFSKSNTIITTKIEVFNSITHIRMNHFIFLSSYHIIEYVCKVFTIFTT